MDLLDSIRGLFEFAFPFLEQLFILRAILGFILVFFLPGFAWTLVFFRKVNILERIALSFGLSIAVVTLSLLALNKLFEFPITGLYSALVIIVITIIPVVIFYLNRLISQRREDANTEE